MNASLARGKGEDRLPTLPAVVARLITTYSRENYSLSDIVEILEHDPAISSRILKLANSMFYGLSGDVRSVGGAVMLLGAATVQGLALGASLLKPWEEKLAPKAVRDSWTHSYLTAEGAKGFAAEEGTVDANLMFTAGLLHDVGKIIFLKRDPVFYAEMLEVSGTGPELLEAESNHFGENHRTAGCEALKRWGLPPVAQAMAIVRGVGEVRTDIRKETSVFVAAHDLLTGRENGAELNSFGAAAVEKLRLRLWGSLEAAEAFYLSISGAE